MVTPWCKRKPYNVIGLRVGIAGTVSLVNLRVKPARGIMFLLTGFTQTDSTPTNSAFCNLRCHAGVC